MERSLPEIDGLVSLGHFSVSSHGSLHAHINASSHLPNIYDSNNVITEIVERIVLSDSLHLSSLKHRNSISGHPFRCLSYFTKEQVSPAICTKDAEYFVATFSIEFIWRLVKICHLSHAPIEATLAQVEGGEKPSFKDSTLNLLLEGETAVSEAEALTISADWPISYTGDINPSYTLFCDLVRIITLHEWAHALCGHLTVVEKTMGTTQYSDFSKQREDYETSPECRPPNNELYQAMELHADEFAARFCVRNILWGYDTAIGHETHAVDLVTRLLIFNTACSIFAIIWSLSELNFKEKGIFFLDYSGEISNSTHPPAALRYDRLREFERQFVVYYSLENPLANKLSLLVDSISYRALDIFGDTSPYFLELLRYTPFLMRPPIRNALEEYEKKLMTSTSEFLRQELSKHCYAPTVEY